MKWQRRLFSLGLTFVLLASVSCTTSEGPMGVSGAEVEQQPSHLLGDVLGDGLLGGVGDVVDGTVGTVLGVTDLLVCSSQPYDIERKTVGPDGATINVGSHTLVIPRGALKKKTAITAEQIPGRNNSVRFSPEGLEFQKPASLTMSYKNCLLVLFKKHIVYTDEKLNILEVLKSFDLFGKRTVTAPIDHFSRYVVAY
jgi:hypothetical protein